MLSILHVSDIHFGPPHSPQPGEALLRIAPTLAPDLIVASGDFTQRAKAEQFAAAREFLDKLPDVPLVVVPGNHDVPLYRLWERALDPMALYRRHISEELETTLQLKGAVVVGLDTTSPYLTITRGRITKAQVDFAARGFESALAEDYRILVIHHQPVPAPDGIKDRAILGGSKALGQFSEMGVDLVLAGHLHRAFVGNSKDFLFDRPRDRPQNRNVLLVNSGTTTSMRGRGRERRKNSFNFVQLHDTKIEVTNYRLFDDTGEFAPLSRKVFPRFGCRLE